MEYRRLRLTTPYSSCCFKLGAFALDDQLVAIWAASQRAVRSKRASS
jgi:hypothetical protein